MADKFLSRPDEKQRILRLDLTAGRPANDSALVVTAERTRLTYFSAGAGSGWQFAAREHDALSTLAIGPSATAFFPWSRRNGVAANEKLGAAVFKRVFKDAAGLFVDLLELGPDGPRLMADAPIPVPLQALGYTGVGIDLWAQFVGDELLVVAQLWGPPPGQPDGGPPRFIVPVPHLCLLRARLDQSLPDSLADRHRWTVIPMDKGGFDLDARVESGRVWAVHRRQGEAMSLGGQGLDTPNDNTVLILDSAQNTDNLDFSSVVGQLPPVVVVSCDLATSQCRIDADDVPSVERPQLHRTDPLIISGDRLRGVQIGVQHQGPRRRFVPKILSSEKWVIWKDRAGWVTDSIEGTFHNRWPLNLEEIASVQWMIDASNGSVAVGTLASLRPLALVGYQATEKGRTLAFVRESPECGGIVTDSFRIGTFVGSRESLRWEGRTVLDVGHEAIVRSPDEHGNDTSHPAEHTQFLPFFIQTDASLADGDTVRVEFGGPQLMTGTRNTLGGLLVADQQLGIGLLGYAGMGDGGGRILFAPGIDPLPPATTRHDKSLPPETVLGTGAPGRAWVELHADGWIDSLLPGYFVPYSDVARHTPVTDSGLVFALTVLPVEQLLHHFTPRSIGSGIQLQLDALPVAALLTAGSGFTIDDITDPTFELDRASADGIQAALAAASGPSDVFNSVGAEFPSSFSFTPGVAQGDLSVTFTAAASPPAGAATFAWIITPPPIGPPPAFPGGGPPPSVTLPGSPLNFTFPPFEGRWTFQAVATAPDGSTSSAAHTLAVAQSLWDQVWGAQRSISNDAVAVASSSLEISKFRIDFHVDGQGRRSSVTLNYLPVHRTQLRFLDGVDGQQGRVALRLPVTISSTQATFTGLLGTVLKLNKIDVTLRYERRFTLSVLTSERRSFDVARGQTYADLDSSPGTPADPRTSDVQTIRELHFSPDRLTDALPGAIAAQPVDTGELTLDTVHLDTEFSDLAGGLGNIFAVILTLALAGPIIAPIIGIIALGAGPLAPVVLLAGLGLLALVAVAIGLGLGALLRPLARRVLTDFATGIARTQLQDPATLRSIRDGLDGAQVMTYAGEGIAEAVAIQAIRQAIIDGHPVVPPAHDQDDPDHPGQKRSASGRERFREQFFETAVVGAGVCRVLLRVP